MERSALDDRVERERNKVMNALRYKEWTGVFAYDEEAKLLHGRVVGLRDIVTFEGRSVEELKTALADSVEDYLEFCLRLGREAELPSRQPHRRSPQDSRIRK